MKTALNVKNMKETYLNAKKDMGEVWRTFWNMHSMGFITYDEWKRFHHACARWEYDPERNAVIDFDTEEIIKEF